MEEKNTKNNYLKQALLGALAIIVYFVISRYASLPLVLLNVDIDTLPLYIKVIYSLASDFLIAIILVLIFKNTLINNFKDLKKNHLTYFKTYIKYWFLALAIMMFSNLIILLITSGDIANNEEIIRQNFNENPLYIFIAAVLLAPIIEELVFRQAFRNIFTNNWLFIILSGFIFGSLHVFTSYQTPTDLLYLIPYCTPGAIFAYTLVKSKNIFVPMGLHFIHNGILLSLQFVVLIFG